ncbi:SNPC4-like protein [Mya arenaria]|uniref:SNPC4-like protein n=1 Tax=Mya arenaria TaxID=6604 RepID=A0ABY7GC29_MYAAR|nr:SNPC4-like protein [Mya arenaria]
MDVDHEDIDEDIEQLNKVLQDEDDEEGEESEGEMRSLELDGESYTDRDGSRPSTSTDVTSSFPTTSICTDPDDMSVRFDSSTINAESCLAMNRAYQEVLLDTLRQIEMSLAENRTKQSKLQQEVKDASRSSNYEKKMAGKGKRCTEQNIPYFRDKDGFYPPANEDVKIKQTLKEDKTYVKAKPGWSKTQRQTLISAVKEDAIQQLVRPLLSKLEVESEKANKCKNKEEIDASKTRIQHLYDEMKGKYDATECEKMWRTVLQPGINKEKWSEDEDKKLEELVEKHNMRDWKAIAEELGTNRTPYQCLQHYQEEHFDYDQSPWTEAEDELLKEVVETCRYGSGVIPWPQVAYYIERRSTKMCEMRWSKVDPSLTHGRWTEAEDMALLAAVQLMGNACDWNVIKDFVPGRNAMQCRERFLKSLDSSVNFDHFTYTEDRIVLQSYNDLGETSSEKNLAPSIQLRNLPGFKKATPRTLISNTTKRRYKQTDEGAKNKQTDKGSKDLIGEARKLVEMGTEGYEEMKDAEELQAFVDRTGIKVNDYAKLNRDIAEGGNSTVVWRPPPLSLSSERYFRQMVDKFSQLQVLVKRQALKEINKLYDSKEDLSAEDAQHLKVLGEMFSQQPWEESDSEDEKRRKRRRVQDMESDSSDEEYFTKLEKEAQKREKERKLKAARRSLDVDSKVVFNKAYHTRRKITAMAMLKPMEKIKRTRSQCRR